MDMIWIFSMLCKNNTASYFIFFSLFFRGRKIFVYVFPSFLHRLCLYFTGIWKKCIFVLVYKLKGEKNGDSVDRYEHEFQRLATLILKWVILRKYPFLQTLVIFLKWMMEIYANDIQSYDFRLWSKCINIS
jgi:hypothetical protein